MNEHEMKQERTVPKDYELDNIKAFVRELDCGFERLQNNEHKDRAIGYLHYLLNRLEAAERAAKGMYERGKRDVLEYIAAEVTPRLPKEAEIDALNIPYTEELSEKLWKNFGGECEGCGGCRKDTVTAEEAADREKYDL